MDTKSGATHVEPSPAKLHGDPLMQALREPTGRAPAPQTAHEVRREIDRLQAFTDDELREIPVLSPGTPLSEGQHYLDLSERSKGPFRAGAAQVARPGQFLVAEAHVLPTYWVRLVGKKPPEP